MKQDQQTYRRATGAALAGFGVQLVLSIVMGLTGLYSQSPALLGIAWHLLGGLMVWAVLVGLYYQHAQERAEALEIAGLVGEGSDATGALFDEHEQELHRSRGRLQWLYSWGFGLVSLVVGLYLVVVGGLLWRVGYVAYQAGVLVDDAVGESVNTIALMVVTLGVGFVAFITARYEAGMTKVPQWQVLRGGAGYLMGNFMVAVLGFVGAVCAHFGNEAVLGGLRLAVPAVMLVVGGEMLLAQVLSIYRPRRAGEVSRPGFDSRLLGWLTSPESIAKAIGDTINYQFGFEVSRSWFYRLLGRSITPLMIFGVLVLLLSSTVVIVAPYEQAVVTRYGRRVSSGNQDDVLGPGLSFKWPWPVERVQRYQTGRVHQVTVGSIHSGHSGHEHDDHLHTMLWTHTHDEAEQYLVVAPTPLGREGREGRVEDLEKGATGLSLVGAKVAVQFRVVDLGSFIEAASDSKALVEAVAERRVCAYYATQDIDGLLGTGRSVAGPQLQDQIQKDVDALGLGIKVVFVGVIGIHPPADAGVAAAFLEQIDAIQERQGMIEQAHQEATEALVSVAGSREKALEINGAILELERLGGEVSGAESRESHTAKISDQEVAVEGLLTSARGQAAQLIFEARADRWYRAVTERAKADRFEAELMAFREAPNYYRTKRYLDVLSESLVHARKYIMTSRQVNEPVFKIDLKDAGSAIETIFEDGQ